MVNVFQLRNVQASSLKVYPELELYDSIFQSVVLLKFGNLARTVPLMNVKTLVGLVLAGRVILIITVIVSTTVLIDNVMIMKSI